jgi:predicted nucleic acid-binding protein
MCLIVDSNAIPVVFNKSNQEHQDFEPILNWIINGNGKIVYGGKKIRDEYKKLVSYLRILKYLEDKRKIVRLNDDEVDKKQIEQEKIEKSRAFNDSHIVAMVIISKVRIVCTNDTKSLKYVKDSKFYPKDVKIPKIYSKAKHKDLLVDENIAPICKPCENSSKESISSLMNLLKN